MYGQLSIPDDLDEQVQRAHTLVREDQEKLTDIVNPPDQNELAQFILHKIGLNKLLDKVLQRERIRTGYRMYSVDRETNTDMSLLDKLVNQQIRKNRKLKLTAET